MRRLSTVRVRPVHAVTAIGLTIGWGLGGCAGYGPLGEPAPGIAGLKAAQEQHETAKVGKPGVTPRGGGSAEAPTGPDGAPTLGATDSVTPQ